MNQILKKNTKDFPHIKIFKSTYSIKNLHEFDTKEQYLVFAGIGNFDSFIDMLKKNNFKIIDTIAYPVIIIIANQISKKF